MLVLEGKKIENNGILTNCKYHLPQKHFRTCQGIKFSQTVINQSLFHLKNDKLYFQHMFIMNGLKIASVWIFTSVSVARAVVAVREGHHLVIYFFPIRLPCCLPHWPWQPLGKVIHYDNLFFESHCNIVMLCPLTQTFLQCTSLTCAYNKVRELILEGLFLMNLYQLDKQSTKFTIWKYWKGCVIKLDGNDPKFLRTTHGSCITTIHLLTRHCLWGSF